MKKRTIGTLLLGGAFLLSSTSVFVSCKNYDDDIEQHTTEISDLQRQLRALQNALEQAKADAEAAYDLYETTLSLEKKIAELEAQLSAADANLKAELEKQIADLKAMTEEDYLSKTEAESLYDLQAYVAKLATTEALQNAIDKLNAAIDGKASQKDLDAIATQIAAIDDRLIMIESWKGRLESLETAIPVCEANIANQQKALEQLIEILLGTGDQEEAAAVRAALNEVTDEAEGLDASTLDALRKKMQAISDIVDNVAPNVNIITVLVSHELKSIVLTPSYYINGIEAVTVPALKNYPLWDKDEIANEYSITARSKKVNVSLSGIAEYHLNPSSANILDYKISFYGHKAITRSGENYVTADSAFITEAYQKNSSLYNKVTGILKVGFKANVDKISALAADELPMIALELTKGDTIVTSDYAMVEPLEYKNFVLADKVYLTANKDRTSAHMDDYRQRSYANINNEHLHTVWRDLVSITDGSDHSNAPEQWAATVEFRYNETLDLGARVATHYDSEDFKGSIVYDKTLSDADFTALGLVYKYETVYYTVGNNKTSESDHITVDENGIVTPHSVNADGTPGMNFNRATIGKLPIVRVRLEDKEGNVYAIGYYKLKIVEEVGVDPGAPEENPPVDVRLSETFYANCSSGAWLKKTLTWSEFEAWIYAALNVSKEEFENTYEIQTNPADADQYTYEVKNGKNTYTKKTALEKIGEISELQDPDNPTTNVLKWEIWNWLDVWSQKNFKYVVDANGKVTAKVTKDDIETCICFKNKFNGKSVYVRFVIPAGQIHFATAEATSGKILNQWFNQFSNAGANTQDEAHEVAAGVGNPTITYQHVGVNDFTKDLHDYFLAGQLSYILTEASHFSAFANKTPVFEFTLPLAEDGNATAANEATKEDDGTWTWKWEGLTNSYKLMLNAFNNVIQVYAVKAKTATAYTKLSVPVDIIRLAANGTIEYVQGNYADDLLNAYGRTERAEREALTAFVKIVIPNACYPLDMTGTEYFNVRFIRPVNLIDVQPATLADAPNYYQYVDLSDLVKLEDWRNYTCVDGTTVLYPDARVGYPFYDISIHSDVNDILTDAHLGESERLNKTYEELKGQLKPAKANITGLDLEIVATKSELAPADPQGNILRYNYNGSELGTYHLYVPVYVKYVFAQGKDAWQMKYATITVSATASSRQK